MSNDQGSGEAVIVIRPKGRSRVLLLCDHASNWIPEEYRNLGLTGDEVDSHVAWDVGAADVTRTVSAFLDARAVLAGISRLVVDVNRQLDRPDLIAAVSHGIPVPGNVSVGPEEHEKRLERYYRPYHTAIHHLLEEGWPRVLVCIHTFSQRLDSAKGDFDIGIRFHEYEALAEDFARRLIDANFSVRMNEPSSGRADIISSAQRHGTRHGIAYFEVLINQRLVSSRKAALMIGQRLTPVVQWLGESCTNS